MAMWALMRAEAPWTWAAAGAMAVAAAAAAVARQLLPATPVMLEWDGAVWRAAMGEGAPSTQLTAVDVVLDFATSLLLRLRKSPAGGLRRTSDVWLHVRRTEVGQAFHPLCTALFARQPGALRHGLPGPVPSHKPGE